MGSGPAKNNECLVNDEDTKLAVKSNKFKFMSLDECLNNLHTMRTYLKSQQNKNKRQRTEPTKLVPISFLELKIKREKNEYVTLKALFDSGASATLINQTAVKHLKKEDTTNTLFSTAAGNFQPMANAG